MLTLPGAAVVEVVAVAEAEAEAVAARVPQVAEGAVAAVVPAAERKRVEAPGRTRR